MQKSTNQGKRRTTHGDVTDEEWAHIADLVEPYSSRGKMGRPVKSDRRAVVDAVFDQTTGNASAAAPASVTGTAIVASSTDWQDADAISAVAYAYHLPVVLTSATTLSATAQTELVRLGYDQVIVVGGQLAVTAGQLTQMRSALAAG